MNQFEMIVLIVAIVMIGSVLKARLGGGRRHREVGESPETSAENQRLKQEVRALHERIAVLERITVEKENSLEREIEKLRDR
ncbi:MAG TPA: hypothetical protein VFQ67_12800 [Allosphingosinicella sp.]|jgi:uncharacterized protein YlxW (UPF0749 family)|nr:hypothetical protein [Allosphingosinicella sp.]